MNNNKMDTVTEIRAFNRFYTEIIGLLGQHILDSGYSLTEARVLLEISRTKNAAAHKLADVLGVDRSYMSRIIAKFEKEGLITRQANKNDSRASDIRLTDEGRRVFRELDERSNCQIMQLVSGLGEEEQAQLRQAMKTIKKCEKRAVIGFFCCVRAFPIMQSFSIKTNLPFHARRSHTWRISGLIIYG